MVVDVLVLSSVCASQIFNWWWWRREGGFIDTETGGVGSPGILFKAHTQKRQIFFYVLPILLHTPSPPVSLLSLPDPNDRGCDVVVVVIGR